MEIENLTNSPIVDPTISAEEYQLQHAHSNILKKPLDEVLRLKDPPEAYAALPPDPNPHARTVEYFSTIGPISYFLAAQEEYNKWQQENQSTNTPLMY